MRTVLPDQVPAWLFWLHPSCCEGKQSVLILWSHLTLFNGERSFFVLFYVLPWPAAGLAPTALYGFFKDSQSDSIITTFLRGLPWYLGSELRLTEWCDWWETPVWCEKLLVQEIPSVRHVQCFASLPLAAGGMLLLLPSWPGSLGEGGVAMSGMQHPPVLIRDVVTVFTSPQPGEPSKEDFGNIDLVRVVSCTWHWAEGAKACWSLQKQLFQTEKKKKIKNNTILYCLSFIYWISLQWKYQI